MPSDQKVRDTKRDLISLTIACFHYEKPIEIAERAMKTIEDYERKLKDWRDQKQ